MNFRTPPWKPVLTALLLHVSPLSAQETDATPDPPPSQELLLMELDRRRPDEMSPFFANREAEQLMSTEAGRRMVDQQGVAIYPNTASYDSVDRIVGTFFGGMFRSIRIVGQKPVSLVSISVVPDATFVLETRREISVTLTVTNRTRKLMRLYFPNEQRFDLVLRDAAGTILERWSDDRIFGETEGVVMINPEEKIEYSGTLSTREMKAGDRYIVEASLSGNPEYTQTLVLQPE